MLAVVISFVFLWFTSVCEARIQEKMR